MITIISFWGFSLDFAMFVFLWLVQLLIYPSFNKIKSKEFTIWHKGYQRIILVIMGPIMISQMCFIVLSFIIEMNYNNLFRLLFLSLAWGWTLCVSVPLHKRIQCNNGNETDINTLIKSNWIRTLAWTLILFTHIFI